MDVIDLSANNASYCSEISEMQFKLNC